MVAQSAAEIVEHGLTAPVRWLPEPSRWSFLADPLVRPDGAGGWTLFAEHMDYLDGKGSIWAGPFRPERQGADWAALSPAVQSPVHLSFPQAWPGDTGRITCESWEACGVATFRREADGPWRDDGLLMPGVAAVDPVLHHDGARWWLFCTHAGPTASRDLHLYWAEAPGGPWQAHPANPVVSDATGARPGGPLFRIGDRLIRPAQDCSATYGGALVLHEVAVLTPERYEERAVRRLTPTAPYGAGLHTLCPAGDWTVIDGKRWRSHPLEPLRKLWVGRRNRRRRAALAQGRISNSSST